MSAETLRRAAASMREHAEKATPGRWKLWAMEVRADIDGTSDLDTSLPVAVTYHEAGLRTFNATHIAGWDPPVALTVADWLDNEAAHAERNGTDWRDPDTTARHALTIACAYLRERS